MRGAREGVQLGGLGEEAHLVIVFVGAWRPGKGRLVGRAAQQAHWELWGHILARVGVGVLGLGLAHRLLLERVGSICARRRAQERLLQHRRGRGRTSGATLAQTFLAAQSFLAGSVVSFHETRTHLSFWEHQGTPDVLRLHLTLPRSMSTGCHPHKLLMFAHRARHPSATQSPAVHPHSPQAS